MIARILRVDVPAETINSIVGRYRETVRPIHAAAAGLGKHYVRADRTAGRITIVGIWDSDEALKAVAPILEPARAELWREFGEAPTVERY
jgi:hypothetical protein